MNRLQKSILLLVTAFCLAPKSALALGPGSLKPAFAVAPGHQVNYIGATGPRFRVASSCELHTMEAAGPTDPDHFDYSISDDVPAHLREETDKLVKSFYLETPEGRYFHKGLKVRVSDRGKRLNREGQNWIEGQNGEQIFLFHRLETTLNSSTFVGIFGVGFVTAERFLKGGQSETTSLELERRLADEQFLANYLNDEGIPTAHFMGIVEVEDRFYLIKSYESGPTLNDLAILYRNKLIDQQDYELALERYQTFMDKLTRAQSTDEFKRLAASYGTHRELSFDDTAVVYVGADAGVDGHWKLVKF